MRARVRLSPLVLSMLKRQACPRASKSGCRRPLKSSQSQLSSNTFADTVKRRLAANPHGYWLCGRLLQLNRHETQLNPHELQLKRHGKTGKHEESPGLSATQTSWKEQETERSALRRSGDALQLKRHGNIGKKREFDQGVFNSNVMKRRETRGNRARCRFLFLTPHRLRLKNRPNGSHIG
jgi:hypothetical protein